MAVREYEPLTVMGGSMPLMLDTLKPVDGGGGNATVTAIPALPSQKGSLTTLFGRLPDGSAVTMAWPA